MYISPKRLIKTKEGKIVEAGPGVSGNLVVAQGAEISEDYAVELGLMKSLRDARPVQRTAATLHAGQVAAGEEKADKPWDSPVAALSSGPTTEKKVEEKKADAAPLPK